MRNQLRSVFKAISIITISFLSTSLIVACGAKDSKKPNLRRHISGRTKVENGFDDKKQTPNASGPVAADTASGPDSVQDASAPSSVDTASSPTAVEDASSPAAVSSDENTTLDEINIQVADVNTDAPQADPSAQVDCSPFKSVIEQELVEANGQEITLDAVMALTDSYELEKLSTFVEVKNIDDQNDPVDTLYGVIQSSLVNNNNVLSLESNQSGSTGVLCQSAQITETQFAVELSVPNHLGVNHRDEAKQRTHRFSISDATSQPAATVVLEDLIADQDPLIDLPVAAELKIIKVSNEQGEHILVFSSFEEAEEKTVSQFQGPSQMTHVKYWVLLKYNKVEAAASSN